MSEIPVDIMESAERCLTQTQWNPETVRAIAQAILAERKRCAEIVNNRDWAVIRYEETSEDMLQNIVSAILSPTAQENER